MELKNVWVWDRDIFVTLVYSLLFPSSRCLKEKQGFGIDFVVVKILILLDQEESFHQSKLE